MHRGTGRSERTSRGRRRSVARRSPLLRCRVAGGVPHAPASRRNSAGPAMSRSDPPAATAAARTARTSSALPATAQFAIPVPGEAHHCSSASSRSRMERSWCRGAAIRAQRAGAAVECSCHTDASAAVQPRSATIRLVASGLPRNRASTRPLEKSSTAAGAIGMSRTCSAATQASAIDSCFDSTVTSCSALGNTLKDAATITPVVPSAP